MSLTTTFLNHSFENPLMNASGVHCMTTAELDELAHSNAGAFITKSCTINERAGNPEPRYYDVPLGSINSMGLPNLGFSYYLDYALAYEKEHGQEQPLFFSIAGMSAEENLEMLKLIEESDYQGITELNLSCPNVPGKPQPSLRFRGNSAFIERSLSSVLKTVGNQTSSLF